MGVVLSWGGGCCFGGKKEEGSNINLHQRALNARPQPRIRANPLVTLFVLFVCFFLYKRKSASLCNLILKGSCFWCEFIESIKPHSARFKIWSCCASFGTFFGAPKLRSASAFSFFTGGRLGRCPSRRPWPSRACVLPMPAAQCGCCGLRPTASLRPWGQAAVLAGTC